VFLHMRDCKDCPVSLNISKTQRSLTTRINATSQLSKTFGNVKKSNRLFNNKKTNNQRITDFNRFSLIFAYQHSFYWSFFHLFVWFFLLFYKILCLNFYDRMMDLKMVCRIKNRFWFFYFGWIKFNNAEFYLKKFY